MVLLKGRAACEVDAADELVATELLFNGALGELDKHQLVALLSCLVPVEKSGEAIKLTQAMAGPLAQLQVRSWVCVCVGRGGQEAIKLMQALAGPLSQLQV